MQTSYTEIQKITYSISDHLQHKQTTSGSVSGLGEPRVRSNLPRRYLGEEAKAEHEVAKALQLANLVIDNNHRVIPRLQYGQVPQVKDAAGHFLQHHT